MLSATPPPSCFACFCLSASCLTRFQQFIVYDSVLIRYVMSHLNDTTAVNSTTAVNRSTAVSSTTITILPQSLKIFVRLNYCLLSSYMWLYDAYLHRYIEFIVEKPNSKQLLYCVRRNKFYR